MDAYAILSLVFGILGILSSYWYIGIVPCAIGAAIGIIGLIESYLDNKSPIAVGMLLSILGAVLSVFFIISDIDSDSLVLNSEKFGGEKVASIKNDDFMKFHKEETEQEKEDSEMPVLKREEEKTTPYWIDDSEYDERTSNEPEEKTEETGQIVSTQPEEPKENSTKSNKSVYHTGETANYNGLELTFLGYQEYSGGDYEFNTPDSGKTFVYAEFELYNGTNGSVSLNPLINFLYYCDGYSIEASTNAIMSAPSFDIETFTGDDILSGKSARACLPLELPSDWREMEIYYRDNYYGDTKFSFVFNK